MIGSNAVYFAAFNESVLSGFIPISATLTDARGVDPNMDMILPSGPETPRTILLDLI
ncbi:MULTISPECIES: hypothetical protein [unclassified Acidovorax]|uniref:hypothetical protein n=1 Tax=unclassified Acidovorax TaxID=2684926 RepID=UPI001C43D88A|nr:MULTISPECIES: hypothetical protein [unclassified Acidovorax]MBV7427366.1 hypothetical protein [Acidovorax sp. sif0732]MBV7448490.1 hypothetical protein [Acidovorax sp. sif0715]